MSPLQCAALRWKAEREDAESRICWEQERNPWPASVGPDEPAIQLLPDELTMSKRQNLLKANRDCFFLPLKSVWVPFIFRVERGKINTHPDGMAVMVQDWEKGLEKRNAA